MNRTDAIEILRRVAGSIVDTVREAGTQGAPESSITLALESQGFAPSYAAEIVNALVSAGKLTRRNHLLFLK